MAVNIQGNQIVSTASKPSIDADYGPYTGSTLQEALNSAESALKYKKSEGKTIGIKVGTNSIIEYWYKFNNNNELSLTEKTPDLSSKQDIITNSNKLDADLVEDANSDNKFVTSSEKTTWEGKQDALTTEQLSNITKGGTALQPSSTSGLLKNDGTVDTETQSKAANAIQMPSGATSDKVLGYENDAVAWVDRPQDGEKGDKGDKGEDAVNPFKGYYPSGVSKPATGAVGDYLYAPPSDSQSTATATIWHYDSTQTPPWTDTEIDVSAVVGVEFGSRQAVTATKIKDENGEEVQGTADVLSSEAGMELLRKIKEHHEIDGTAQSSSSTTVEIIPAAANNVECKAGDILFFDVDGIGTVYEQVRYFLNGDNNTPYYINEKYTFAPLTSDLTKIRVAAVSGKYISDGTITCNIYKVGQGTFVKLIGELLGRVSNVEDATTQIPALESAINSIQLEMNSTILVNASGEVPSGTPATYNLFNNQINKIPANSDVRFEVTGLGTVYSQINWYISGASGAVAHPLTEPVTVQHFSEETNIGRVAVPASKIIGTAGGAVSFKATVVGLKEKVEELANSDVKSVLQLLQDAANVTDNFFTNSFNTTIHAPSYSGNLIFTCVSKYTIDANYVSGEPTIRIVGVGGSEGFNCPATYNMSNLNDFTFKQWRLPQLKEGVNDSIKIEITIPTGVELIISSFEVAVEPKALSGGNIKIYSHGNMGNSNFCTKGAWDRASQCGAYGCIAVPKRTSDGVLVSYHNDGNVNSDMMHVDGSTIADGVTIANSTFETTQTWRYKTAFLQRFGNYKEGNTDIIDTARIPKLEELFKLCVKTGIKPCLSVHPLPASDDEAGITAFTSMLTDIKTLTDKYNITNLVSFKIGSSGVHCLQYLFQVFGNGVDCVMISGAANLSLANVISSLSNSGFDKTKITLGAEFNGVNDYPNYIDGLNTEGYIVGVFGESIQATVIMGLIDAGVQEITLNNFYSWGLNW